MPDHNRTITMSDIAVSSNPGQLKVNFLHYMRCFPNWWTIYAVGLISCGLILLGSPFLLHGVLLVLTLLVIVPLTCIVGFLAIYHAIHVRERFRVGDVCPALVVATDPYLIAVSTDLTMGYGSFPVIKIITHPLHAAAGGPFSVGTRLATVAIYSCAPGAGRWEDVHPIAVNCATTNTAEINRVLSSISRQQWVELQHGLMQLTPPLEPGLYGVAPCSSVPMAANIAPGDDLFAPAPQTTVVSCRGCGRRFQAAAHLLGTAVKCPACSTTINVPAAAVAVR